MAAVEAGSTERQRNLALYIGSVVCVLMATCFRVGYEALIRCVCAVMHCSEV